MSTAAATVPPPPMAPSSGAGRLDDFSDKLSPMLVKELRQGLRAKSFVIVFLAVQALLALVLLTVMSSAEGAGAGQTVSEVIFFFFALAVLVIQPMRGIGALHNEIKGNTIDLMVLTRLGAWRIVLGKWVAIVSQSALLLTAIAPYLILRYFFGRMNLFAELLLLVLVFLGSAVFTALTVGLSAIGPIIIRGLVPLGIGLVLVSGIFEIIFGNDLHELIGFCTLQAKGSVWGLLTGLLTGTYVAWFCLGFGASMIAPMAENHSTVRRLLAICAVVLVGLLAWAGDFEREPVSALLVLFCVPAIAIALTEPFQLLPPICRPFVKSGGAGRLAGRFLYPGWPSGVLFTALLLGVAAGAYFLLEPRSVTRVYGYDNTRGHVAMLVFIGTLLLPAIILQLFSGKVKQSFPFYLLILVGLCGITLALGMIANETENDSFLWLFCWVPPVKFLLIDLIQSQHYAALHTSGGHLSGPAPGMPNFTPVLITGLVTTGIYLLILLFFALRKFPAIAQVEHEAENKPEIENTP
jgi:hypothetical protein